MWLFQPSEFPVYVVLEGAECLVLVDGEQVCHCSSLPMAIGLYAICFYVFNLSFLDNSVKTLLFLQKFAFKLHDPSRDSRVMRIYRACDAIMDKLSKKKAASSQKSGKGTHSRTCRVTGNAKPRLRVEPGTTPELPAATVGGSDLIASPSSPSVMVASAPSDLAGQTKRGRRPRKIPGRLRE